MDIRTIILSLVSCLCISFSSHAQREVTYIYTHDGERIISSLPQDKNTIYRVEVARLPSIAQKDPELKNLKKFGKLNIEKFDGKDEISLLIGNYSSSAKAKSILSKIHEAGFVNARIIAFKHGFRI